MLWMGSSALRVVPGVEKVRVSAVSFFGFLSKFCCVHELQEFLQVHVLAGVSENCRLIFSQVLVRMPMGPCSAKC